MFKKSNTRFCSDLRKSALWAVLLTVSMLGLSACNKDNNEDTPGPKQASNQTLQYILNMGFARANIEDKGNHYLVEGDIVFNKEESTANTPTSKDGVIVHHQDQAHYRTFIAYNKQPNITVRIDGSFPAQWHADVVQALADWNGIEACHVNLTLTTASNANITIYGVKLPMGFFGRAPLPSNGNPGSYVDINIDDAPDYRRRTTIVHELGHCLGLVHTDVFDTGEIANFPHSTVIPGTPVRDANSVMNSGGAPNRQLPWQGFSSSDVVAIQNLYPPISSQNTFQVIAQHSGKALDVTARAQHNGASVTQHDYLGGANQHWQFEDRGDGYFNIIARHSGKLLDVTYGLLDNNASVSQHDNLDVSNQQWKMIPIGNGYFIIENRRSGKALDVTYGSQDNGAQVAQHDYLGVANQHWLLAPL